MEILDGGYSAQLTGIPSRDAIKRIFAPLKLPSLVAVVVALCFTPVFAQVPVATPPIAYAPAASMSVNAHEIGTGKGIERNWQTDYGSYDRDTYRTKGLQVEVRNISKLAGGKLEVTVCWTARELSGKRAMRIHHAETLPASVTAVSNATLRFWSPLIASNVTNYNAIGQQTKEGGKIDGWFVIVTRDGHMINGVGSTHVYQKLIETPTELEPLLAAYRPSGKSATSEMPKWRKDPVRTEWRSRRAYTGNVSESFPHPLP